MKSWKQIKEDAKMFDQAMRIKRKLKNAKGDALLMQAQEKAEDMQIMITNFGKMLKMLYEAEMKCFELAGKDSVRLPSEIIYKDKEERDYQKIKEWFDQVKGRWSK